LPVHQGDVAINIFCSCGKMGICSLSGEIMENVLELRAENAEKGL
jgi:hypothetical protein